MKYSIRIIIYFFLIFLPLKSEDLTRQLPIEKTVFLKGITGVEHYFDPTVLYFNTGKLYKLTIKNISDSKHYFSSNSFSKAIFTRKIQINFNQNKLAEIKGIINEVEVWPGQEIEWWFVPIKTGEFNDLKCDVEDTKNKIKHSKMGMIGKIIIE